MLALLTSVICASMFEKDQVRLEEERGAREQKRKMLYNLCHDIFESIAGDASEEVSIVNLKEGVPHMIGIFMKCGFAFTELDLCEVIECSDSQVASPRWNLCMPSVRALKASKLRL